MKTLIKRIWRGRPPTPEERAAAWAKPIPNGWHETAMLWGFYRAMTPEQQDRWLREIRDKRDWG